MTPRGPNMTPAIRDIAIGMYLAGAGTRKVAATIH